MDIGTSIIGNDHDYIIDTILSNNDMTRGQNLHYKVGVGIVLIIVVMAL